MSKSTDNGGGDDGNIGIIDVPKNKKINNKPNKEVLIVYEKLNILVDKQKQELSDICFYIDKFIKENIGQGGQFTAGSFVELAFINYIKGIEGIDRTVYHKGENDCKISDIPFSFKKISGP